MGEASMDRGWVEDWISSFEYEVDGTVEGE
jgi:hypothetical protein